MTSRFLQFSAIFAMTTMAPLAKAETQLWSDAHGYTAASLCEVSSQDFVLDPKLNPYVENAFVLADGSQWQARRVNGNLQSMDCLEKGQSKKYVLFDVINNKQILTVGVTASETTVFNAPVQTPAMKASALPAGVEVAIGSLDYVVCISGPTLNVRDQSLNKVLFTAAKHSSVKPVQSFGTDRLKKIIDGVTYTFIKAEFPQVNATNKIGWVAENYIVVRAQCPGAAAPAVPEAPVAQWTFPTIKRPSLSYKEGMRRFKASRSGGRLHAACDLYRVINEGAVAIANGTVIRDRYYFYEGTYALEIKHSGGKVARYGEITGKAATGVALNKSVTMGQVIGYIGKVNSGCCTPMLHFELYAGTSTGALSQSGNSYGRRKDLIDPTALLTEWEKLKFGKSY